MHGCVDISFYRILYTLIQLTEHSSESKITEFDNLVLRDEDIFWFDVSVNDSMLVTVVDSLQCLPYYLLQQFLLKSKGNKREIQALNT